MEEFLTWKGYGVWVSPEKTGATVVQTSGAYREIGWLGYVGDGFWEARSVEEVPLGRSHSPRGALQRVVNAWRKSQGE